MTKIIDWIGKSGKRQKKKELIEEIRKALFVGALKDRLIDTRVDTFPPDYGAIHYPIIDYPEIHIG